jgi:hypothetical protein
MTKKLTGFVVLLVSAILAFPLAAKNLPQRAITSKKVDTEAVSRPVVKGKKMTGKLPRTRKANARSSQFSNSRVSHFSYRQIDARKQSILRVNSNINIWGNVIYSDDDPATEDQATPNGYYEINGSGKFTLLGGTSTDSTYYMSANVCAFTKDGKLYTIDATNFWGYVWATMDCWNTETWTREGSSVYLDEDFYASSAAYDSSTGYLYGCFATYDDDDNVTWTFAKANPFTNDREDIRAIDGESWNSTFFDKNGQFYAIDYTGDLYKVDKTTGVMTKVGATGYVPEYTSGACYDPRGNKAYWSVSDVAELGYLCEVDLTTGVATKVCDFPYNEEVVGLCIPEVNADAKAPDYVTNLSATFDGYALIGTISFTMPTKSYDGSDLTDSSLKYTVYNNGTAIATGTAAPGAQVTVNVTVADSGNCKFEVSATNSVGEGPKDKISKFVGVDTPKAPANVTATYSDGIFNVSWDAVTACVNGGYFDSAAVTYTVTRMPDNVVVAQNITGTTITDAVSNPANLTVYYYTVTATVNGKTSAEGTSGLTALGCIQPPYMQTFDEASSLEGFTIIDANNDGTKWNIYQGRARIRYSSENDMDDWLITPPVELKAGYMYNFSVELEAYMASYPERAEIFMGTAPTAAAMTSAIYPAADITDLTTVSEYVTVPADGVYYFGIHGISDADMYYLFADNLSISSPMSVNAPSAVTDIVVAPDATGALSANISFNAPLLNMAGTGNVSAITKIDVFRGETLVKTFNNPTPGEALSFSDAVTEAGRYVYTFVPYNENGEGKSATGSAYIGINVPGVVSNVVAVETSNVGEVKLTWDAPAVDADGNAINPALVKYNVVKVTSDGYTSIATDITDTTYTFRALAADAEQQFLQFGVLAVTSAGSSNGTTSNYVAVGAPYALPYFDSFDDASVAYSYMTFNSVSSANWGICDDSTVEIADADGTNGFLACQASYVNAEHTITTGKISIADVENPMLSFYTYNINVSNEEDLNRIDVLVSEDGINYTTIKENVISELGFGANSWGKVQVPMAAYKGKVINVAFRAITKTYSYTMLDAVKIGAGLDYDLNAVSIDVPVNTKPDETYSVNVRVSNDGRYPADYSVQLFRNDQLVQTLNAPTLASGEAVVHVFNETLNVSAATTNNYYAVVNYPSDLDLTNNTTQTVSTTLLMPTYPTISNLRANADGTQVALSWTGPDMNSAQNSQTDSFESYVSWATSGVGEWTFYDQDKGYIGGIQGVTLPIASDTQQSFWVMDAADSSISAYSTSFAAHTGTKYLAQMYAYSGDDYVQSDDWAVSPKLSGKAQTISFYARSLSSSYPENFQVLYSTGGNAVSDFKTLKTVTKVPESWTKYSYNLPEGAKYFAIRCTSDDGFMLMIDDVTFASSTAASLSLTGYNIYRDGMLLNPAPVSETSYTDASPLEGAHTYAVSVVYNVGESQAVSALIDPASVSSITAEGTSIAVNGHTITVTAPGQSLVTVNSLDGKVLHAAHGNTAATVGSGIYLVKAGRTVKKVIVK